MRWVIGLLQRGFLLALRPLPRRARLWLLIRVNRLPGLPPSRKQAITMAALEDVAEADRERFHHLLWSHHLAYANWYETSARYAAGVEESRRIFFADLAAELRALGVRPETGVASVLEAGCSIGVNLRFLEQNLFPNATLEGIDIDEKAVTEGRRHLATIGSRAVLHFGDLFQLEAALDHPAYDVVFACGVLLYFEPETATRIIGELLDRTRLVAGFAEAWFPAAGPIRADQARYHDVARLVEAAGGEVLGVHVHEAVYDGKPMHFVFVRGRAAGGQRPEPVPPAPPQGLQP